MTSEASLLPTDLKNIHQTVYRSRRKMFTKLPKSRHELHECLNAFEVKYVKENYFSWQMILKIKWLFLRANRTRRLTEGN